MWGSVIGRIKAEHVERLPDGCCGDCLSYSPG